MRTKIDLLRIFEADRGGASYSADLVMRMSRQDREKRILTILERSQMAPSRSLDVFAERILRYSVSLMPFPRAPKESFFGVENYGGSGASTSAPAAAASASASAAATSSVGNQLPWLFPSSDFLSFQKYGTTPLPVPGIGVNTPIITFKVPNGRNGKITALGIDFVANGGAAFVQGELPAQLSFNLTADGVPFQDFGNFTYMPGTASVPLAMAGLMLREGQTIALTMKNLAIANTTQFVEALIQGYYYSKNLQPKTMGYQ
ncbi:MAG TPA: hypothetical protein VN788_00125 [Verrucomicrobiae bacterium]|nr:hypothetical protein [Verrucomicrobiae bacterium]